MSIIFVARTMETRAFFIVLKMCTHLWGHDMRLLADSIVDVSATRKEYLAIYISIGEVSLQHPQSILVPSP